MIMFDASYLILFLFVLQIILDAKEDVLRQEGQETHFLQMVHLFVVVTPFLLMLAGFLTSNVVFFYPIKGRLLFIMYIVFIYALARFSLFDIVRWHIRKHVEPINYYGRGSFYAKIMNWLSMHVPGFDHAVLVLRILSFGLATLLIQNTFNFRYHF